MRTLLAITILFTTAFTVIAADRAEITADELTKRMAAEKKPLILDVRSTQEYEAGRLIGAVHIPFKEVGRRIGELGTDKSREIVVYCQSGYRAGKAEATLKDRGFTKVKHLIGDWGQWSKENRPFVKGPKNRAPSKDSAKK